MTPKHVHQFAMTGIDDPAKRFYCICGAFLDETGSLNEKEPATSEPTTDCCKCAAYREINQEHAVTIARLMKALESAREWNQFQLKDLDRTLGTKS